VEPASGRRASSAQESRAVEPIYERLPLAAPDGAAALLLTTSAASANAAEASERRARFPEAAAEDMEAFGVATACALAGAALRVVRGISNQVGVRDPSRWRIPAALAAARALALEILAAPAEW
jgi:futalosine hydrolase